ncbi:MAG: glycosyltransferase [Drouetiella hepatica Uher 2000/2452]|jgi:dolichyl-phosphate beta-glucosyltransferase|uniref:Glycosyltransferase n=1 Tax=Drouetiella hepatica Uher 2000/2452 TaxID=904376 RepID=A0A951QFG7_9CYAN|nr:glycosyltransferase [Drouetiella hepatica Uher 2000/2452]
MVSNHLSELELSIIIPAYKETNKIRRDIRAAEAFLKSQRLAGEIVVVDDGSPDDTVAVAKSLEAEIPSLKVLSYIPNSGKGYALRYGITRSQGRIVMFADAGLCVPYDIAKIGLTMLELEMCDIAIGSRRMRGSVRRRQPLYRRLGSKCYGFLIHTLMGLPLYISDTQCGFKLYRGEVARQLYASTFTDGFMFDIEVILRALMEGYQVLEFPVLWSNDADSRFNPLTGSWRLLKDLATIRWKLFQEKRQKSHRTFPASIAQISAQSNEKARLESRK